MVAIGWRRNGTRDGWIRRRKAVDFVYNETKEKWRRDEFPFNKCTIKPNQRISIVATRRPPEYEVYAEDPPSLAATVSYNQSLEWKSFKCLESGGTKPQPRRFISGKDGGGG